MEKYKVIGLMSGTSLDGLDLAYCHFWQTDNTWKFNILQTKSINYNTEFQKKLKSAIALPTQELKAFNNSYGTWLGKQSKQFISENNLAVDYIASHGHTVHHRPEKGYTYQLGSGQHLANESGIKTICDFRTNDVSLGGQGAPLVPIGDLLLFNEYDFCLNLGGISNVSFQQKNKRIAYDIGIANMALNYITQKINLAYDENGTLAKSGSINQNMLQQLNNLEYYKLPFPKSTGYEWFKSNIIPIIDSTNDTIENLLHTTVVHICTMIAEQLKTVATQQKNTLLITGGGALNGFLIDVLQKKLGENIKIATPSKTIIEFKEALIFAFMGVLRSENITNVLSSVTGAERDSCSGVIFNPQ